MATGLEKKTIILVITAAIFGGALYLWQKNLPPPTSEVNVTPSEPIFTLQEADITGLTITYQGQTLKLNRNQSGAWDILEPEEAAGPAETGTVVFLLNLIATARTEKTLTVPLAEAAEFGLAEPVATIEITANEQPSHRLVLGGLTFDQNQLYAQADPPLIPTDPMTVIVVPLQFLDGIQQPLEAWKQQPPPPPGPGSSPSPTVSPNPESPETSPDGT